MNEENNTERKFHDYGVGVYADDAERVAKVTAFIQETFEGCEDGSYTIREKAPSQDGKPRVGGTFGVALQAMKCGKGARLPHWKPDVVIRAQYPDEHSKMTAPYLYVESRFGRVPWKETMIELFSEDWEIVD